MITRSISRLAADVDLQAARWRALARGQVAVAFGDRGGFLGMYDELETLTSRYETKPPMSPEFFGQTSAVE